MPVEAMDPLFLALSFFGRRKFDKAAEYCTEILTKNPYDQAAWCLKLRCLTEQVYVDEVENEEEGIAESLMDDNAMTQVARPGTSLQRTATAAAAVQQQQTAAMPSQAVRPRSRTGRPVTGMVRPGTQSGRPGTMEQAMRTPRTASTARPVTSSSGRFVRLGTASMLSHAGGPFVNVSRLNLSKYAANQTLSKPLFEYLLYHDGDVRTALQLAALATQSASFQDWWWKVQLGKCYHRLGLYRDADKQFKSAIKQEPTIDVVLLLGKTYAKLDQPLSAIDTYTNGLDVFRSDVHILLHLARIYEALNDIETSVRYYKEVLKQEASNIEAIACIGTYHFYGDQPEIALRFYRRILQMGVSNAELYVNIGLCCFYSQQFDLAVGCLERAHSTADKDNQDDIWYNIGHVALASGDISMAYQCFRLALTANNDHAEALNNMGVLELRKGNIEQAKALFQASMAAGEYTYEPFFNFSLLCHSQGHYQAAFVAVNGALKLFPTHAASLTLHTKIVNLLRKV